MEFQLLGPFLMRAGGRVVDVTSPKHRVLLVTLLLEAGSTVSIETLARAVWSDAVPGNPRRALQLHITRLRKALAGWSAGEIITTCRDGYRIEAEPDQVDLTRFHRLLRRAEEAARRDDLDGEAAALRQALALWQGDPLAGIRSETLQQEVAPWLAEQRLQAAERYLRVELRRGRHAETVTALVELTSQNPLRERSWALLIQALHDSGRRTDALDAFHTIRRNLVEELGIDPGQDLLDLHRQVLVGASRPGADGPEHAVPIPRQLPPGVPAFTGRLRELAALDALTADHPAGASGTAIGIITGTAGVGKTALAAHWARRVADQYPDGQLWINMRGHAPGTAVPPERALRRFLRALGVTDTAIPVCLDDQASLYRSLMDGRRMLVVLDNARGAGQVRPLLPGAPGNLVLITSRNGHSGLVAVEGARPLELDLLTPGEAHQMVAARLGADRVRAEPAAVKTIIDLCAGLPLALSIVAAQAAARPEFGLPALAAGLASVPARLDAFAGTDDATELRTVFSWSYRALSADAARLFRLLGLHPGPDVTASAAASLAGVAVPRAGRLLHELGDAHLLTEHTPGRYAFHDLLRTYAAELAHAHDPASERRQAHHRMLDHYLHSAHRFASLLPPWQPLTPAPPKPGVTVETFSGPRQALAWCASEHHVLLAAIKQAADIGFPTYTWQLAWMLSEYFYRGHWHDWALVMRIATDTAVAHGVLPEQAYAHRELARACARLGRLDAADAHIKQALDLSHRLGDRVGLGMAHRVYGVLLEVRGREDEALAHDLAALALFRTVGHRTGQARALNSVGWSHARLGDHRRALEHCRQALVLLKELDDRQGQAATWDSLGYAHHHLGDHKLAMRCYQQALDLFRDLGDRYKEAEILTHLGDAHHAAGDAPAARTAWQRALDIRAELGHDLDPVRTRLRGLNP
jgi:DNA-binding SARP family transcriptional activator/Tfp pilus assembly protein PilF